MRKLLLLLLLIAIFITGCISNDNDKELKYAIIYNDSHNSRTDEPKVYINLYDQDGKFIDNREYQNSIQRIQEDDKEIFLYGDYKDILIYNKDGKNFSTAKTSVANIEQLNLSEKDYLIYRNLGYHDENKLSYDLEAILYNRKHQEIQHYDMLNVKEQIVDAKSTSNIVVLFTDSIDGVTPLHMAHILDKGSGKELTVETFENGYEAHVSLLENDNIYYLFNLGIKDINNQRIYYFPEEIIKLFDGNVKNLSIDVIDDLWYLTIDNSIYQLMIENDKYVINKKIKEKNEIIFSYLNNDGDYLIATKNKDDKIDFYMITDEMNEIKLPIRSIKAKDNNKVFSMIIEL